MGCESDTRTGLSRVATWGIPCCENIGHTKAKCDVIALEGGGREKKKKLCGSFIIIHEDYSMYHV